MTLEQVFWASQCAAAVGVIASLIFVGVEVRNNARAVRSATAQAVEQSFAGIDLALQANPSTIESCIKGVVDYDALTPSEKAQFVCACLWRSCRSLKMRFVSGVWATCEPTCGLAGNPER